MLLGSPRVLIADEPTRGIDVGSKRAIYELLTSLAAQGMGVLPISVQALDQSTWAAFAALVERNNGIFGGCCRMGFHPEQPWPGVVQERVPQKRAAKEQRVRAGKAHAALVFEGEDCVGWCQFGAPEEVGKHRWVMTRVIEPSAAGITRCGG
jgi:ABC-type glutathione transport system ATPase component